MLYLDCGGLKIIVNARYPMVNYVIKASCIPKMAGCNENSKSSYVVIGIRSPA